MRYPIAIEPGDDTHAWGVVVPDLPGCFSAGDTLDEALDNAPEAIALWLETVVEDGGPIPEPAPLGQHQTNPEFAGWVWAVVSVDTARVVGKAKRVNVTIPENLLARIDAAAKAEGESRSGLLTRAAMDYVRGRAAAR